MPAALFDLSQPVCANLAHLIEPVAGGIVSKVLMSAAGVQQTLFALDAAQSIRQHRVPHVAIVHVISGSLRFRVDDQDYDMTPNDWLLMPADAPHAVEAPQPARFLLTLLRSA